MCRKPGAHVFCNTKDLRGTFASRAPPVTVCSLALADDYHGNRIRCTISGSALEMACDGGGQCKRTDGCCLEEQNTGECNYGNKSEQVDLVAL